MISLFSMQALPPNSGIYVDPSTKLHIPVSLRRGTPVKWVGYKHLKCNFMSVNIHFIVYIVESP